MNGRLRTTVLGLTAAAFFGLPAVSSVGLQAQEGALILIGFNHKKFRVTKARGNSKVLRYATN